VPKFWLVLLLVIAPLTGCWGSSPSAPSDTLVYGRGEDADSLDPIQTQVGEAVKVIVNVYDTLVTYDDVTADLVPSLATEWKQSSDGLTWTFTLRDDVRFHDGTSFDADAVVFSFERLIRDEHPHRHHTARPYLPNYRIIEKVVAHDPKTVVFTLNQPSAIFLQNMAMFPASIVSPAGVKQHGEAFGSHPVGTGPFQFSTWDTKQSITLAAFDDHWRGPPGVKQAIFLSVSENSTRAQQLLRGESHVADDLSPSDLERVAKTPGLVVQEREGMNVAYLAMQNEHPVLAHREVREAIWHAIDKAALIRIAYGGKAEPIANLCPPAMWGYDKSVEDRAYDVEQAKSLLDAAAKREGFALPVKLSLSMFTQPRPYMPQPDQVGSFIKDSLGKIGIEVTPQPRTVNEHFTYVSAGKHELALAGWYSDNNDIDNFLYSLLDSDNIVEHGNNMSFYRNADVHKLLLAGQVEIDRQKRLQIYSEAQQLIFADAPVVPLIAAKFRVAQSDKVQGYQLHPTGLVRLRLAHFGAAK
jgi:peptide/nickel transport system substrate-binding protein